MTFIPRTKREEILYQELMDAQIEIAKKNIEISNLKRELKENKKEDNLLKDVHEMNHKSIYDSINHPITD